MPDVVVPLIAGRHDRNAHLVHPAPFVALGRVDADLRLALLRLQLPCFVGRFRLEDGWECLFRNSRLEQGPIDDRLDAPRHYQALGRAQHLLVFSPGGGDGAGNQAADLQPVCELCAPGGVEHQGPARSFHARALADGKDELLSAVEPTPCEEVLLFYGWGK